jgi:hypothetical protein
VVSQGDRHKALVPGFLRRFLDRRNAAENDRAIVFGTDILSHARERVTRGCRRAVTAVPDAALKNNKLIAQTTALHPSRLVQQGAEPGLHGVCDQQKRAAEGNELHESFSGFGAS